MRIALAIMLTAFSLAAHAGAKQKTYEQGIVYGMETTADGGFILTGLLKTNSNDKCFLMKFGRDGQVSWLKSYSDLIEFYSYGTCVYPLPGEGFFFAGVMFHDTISNEQITFSKCDTAGTLVWSREYGNPFDDDGAAALLAAPDGFIIAGHTTAFGPGGEDFFILKTDTAGNQLFARSFGDAADARCMAIVPYRDGYVAGGHSMYSPGDDLFLLYLDSSLNLTHVIRLDIPGKQSLCSLLPDSSGGLTIAAITENTLYEPHALLVRVDSAGQVDWCKERQGDFSVLRKIRPAPGGFAAAGYTATQTGHENIFIGGFDATGAVVHENYFGDSSGFKAADFIVRGDTIILAGSYLKHGQLSPSIYINKHLTGDTACNHFSVASSFVSVAAAAIPVAWQQSDSSALLITPVVINLPVQWPDSVVCDYNPYAGELPAAPPVSLIPNPAGDILQLHIPAGSVFWKAEIYDAAGRHVSDYKLHGNTNLLDVSAIPAGVYTIHLTGVNNMLSLPFFIVR